MTVGEFACWVSDLSHDRMGIAAYCAFVRQAKRDDKQLREEYLAILATIRYMRIGDEAAIELGDKSGEPDATISNGFVFEVVQALPKDEYEVRIATATGSASPFTLHKHSGDHHQFPQAIVDAIESKHCKHYSDSRFLIVAFDGDYSFEDDRVVARWIDDVRFRTICGAFKGILLFERARNKVFPIFFRQD